MSVRSALLALKRDSLEAVELTVAIEEFFRGYIPPEDERKLRNCKTVQEALDYIEQRRKGNHLN
ncbi:MAG TPA: hypothetical protein VKV39_19805 [Candidatus Sulfotelmatobacter sp.]|nr:hypothetical protein [Candidatus Sulfotelmatobacter sp.]